jgi:hypothetical protein
MVLAALSDQGLASLKRSNHSEIVFRGSLSIARRLRLQGWIHIGDPGSWHGYLFDAYQGTPSMDAKLFEVTLPSGVVRDFKHTLLPSERYNNSFIAIAPAGQWMVSGEWGVMTRLLIFPTPTINPAAASTSGNLALAATIALNHPVRDIQGCTFLTATQLLCSSDDPDTDLWSTARQLLQITLRRPLNGHDIRGKVVSLGELPHPGDCHGHPEVEGIDYDTTTRLLRVEVRPPGRCGLATTVYDYRKVTDRSTHPKGKATTAAAGR